jgi:hypothetical protein
MSFVAAAHQEECRAAAFKVCSYVNGSPPTSIRFSVSRPGACGM